MKKTEKKQTTKLFEIYLELNEKQKSELREKFNLAFEFKSKDTFYKKINSFSPLWNYEKAFFIKELNKTESELFEAPKKGVKKC